MTGQRRAMVCRLLIVPPPGEGRVAVERERKVLGEVFLRKGQRCLDWWRRDSMILFFGCWFGWEMF